MKVLFDENCHRHGNRVYIYREDGNIYVATACHACLHAGIPGVNQLMEAYQRGERRFSGQDFSHLQLSNVALEDCAFSETNFVDTEFNGATFNRCSFSSVAVRDTDFTGATFHACTIMSSPSGAKFNNATFDACDLSRISLQYSACDNVKITSSTRVSAGSHFMIGLYMLTYAMDDTERRIAQWIMNGADGDCWGEISRTVRNNHPEKLYWAYRTLHENPSLQEEVLLYRRRLDVAVQTMKAQAH